MIESSIFTGADMNGVSFSNYGAATLIANNFEGAKGLSCEEIRKAKGWQLNYAPQLGECMNPAIFVRGKDEVLDRHARRMLQLSGVELSSNIVVIKNKNRQKIASTILFRDCSELKEIPEWRAIVRTEWLSRDRWEKCLDTNAASN